jgi:hypothetical protein
MAAMDNVELETGAEIWRELLNKGAVDPRLYDHDLEIAVAAALGLPTDGPLLVELDKSHVTARDFLRAMLSALQPLAGMLRDLLDLYTEIGAASADGDSLVIRYEFNESDELDILLANFRRDVLALETEITHALKIADSQDDLWSFPFRAPAGEPVADVPLEDWRRTFVDDRRFVDPPTPIPTNDATLSNEVERAYEIFRTYLAWTRRYASIWEELRTGWGSEGPGLNTLILTHSDFWLPSSVLGLHEALHSSTAPETLALRLRHWINGLPGTPVTTEQLMRVVASLLDLPMWGKRHELYSAWMVAQVHASLPGQLDYVVTDGVLAFPFSGAKLATVETRIGQMEFWTEKRSPVSNPLGKGRASGIQPDYTFFGDESDVSRTTRLAIEAKQYKHSRKLVHANVLVDYAKALPNAAILLAAYGPVSPTVKDRLTDEQDARVHVVRNLKPGDAAANKEFAARVREALPATKLSRVSSEYTVELAWSPSVDDVDLHAFMNGEHVYYGNKKGSGATLSGHTTGGVPHNIRFRSRSNGDSGPVSIWVHPYSSGSSIADAKPRVRLSAGTDDEIFVPASASTKSGLAWHVCDIRADGQILWVDDYAPLPE